jgi:hypothetical protein
MNTKITAVAAILLASVSGAFASEAFDVDIYRPAVNQASEAYAQAPSARQVQVQRRHSAQQHNVTVSEDKAYTGHGSQID